MSTMKFAVALLCAVCAVQVASAFEEVVLDNARWCARYDNKILNRARPCLGGVVYKNTFTECCNYCLTGASCDSFDWNRCNGRCYCAYQPETGTSYSSCYVVGKIFH